MKQFVWFTLFLGTIAAGGLFWAGMRAASVSAQTAPPEEISGAIKVDVDLVNIFCSVHDKHNALIPNLNKEDFEIAEDSVKQPIKYFTRQTDLPLTIGLLVDVSGSQIRLIEEERAAAGQFFSSVLKKKDEAFLISFGTDSELLQDVTQSPRALREGLDRLRPNTGYGGMTPGPVPSSRQPAGTVLYDAIYLAAKDKLSSEAGRKVIVVITDGVDEGSRLKIEDAIHAAEEADTAIYAIYYYDAMAYGGGGGYGISMGGGGEGYLKKMSDQTGGRVFHVDRHNGLQGAFTQLQEEMRSQYSIAYTPTNPKKDGSYRKLDVKVITDKNLKVQTRKGYYANKVQQ